MNIAKDRRDGEIRTDLAQGFIGLGRSTPTKQPHFPLAKERVFFAFYGVRFFLLSLLAMVLTGCATGPDGERLGPWQTLQKWDDSMNTTEQRLHEKNYH